MTQATDTLLLIRPSHFGYNRETAPSNNFQNELLAIDTGKKARREFEDVVKLFASENIGTIVIDDVHSAKTPDAVFPNNWVSFHADGKVVLYPMETPNRRRERRMEVVEKVCEIKGISNPEIIDLTNYEKKGQYLEGTGSIVFDHLNKKAFVALSSRSHITPLNALSEILGYTIHTFQTRDHASIPVYHTNVMMSIGKQFAVVCDSCISEKSARLNLLQEIELTDRKVVSIDGNQMHAFAGNMLEVQNLKGDPYILLSETALSALTSLQRKSLEKYATLLPAPIPVIEKVGGGSIRCMVAEVFLKGTKNQSEVVIRAPKSADEFEAGYSLRWKVLRAPWNQPLGSERDDQEATSNHFIAMVNGKIVGTTRLQELAPGTAQVRYMAVDHDYHGKGIGKQLMLAIETSAKQSGFKRIFLQARENAVPFYKSLGYNIIEKTFLLYSEIQHYSMEKNL